MLLTPHGYTAAGQEALADDNVDPRLTWVQKASETETKHAFKKTLAVHTLAAQGRELADLYFFETLAAPYRVGKGAPFTAPSEGN